MEFLHSLSSGAHALRDFLSATNLLYGAGLSSVFACVRTIFSWLRQERRSQFRSKRLEPVDELMKNDRYLTASEWEFQQAMIYSYGKTVQRSEMAFVMTRTRRLALLRDLMAAKSIIVFRQTCDGWSPRVAGVTIERVTKTGARFGMLGCIFWAIAAETAYFSVHASQALYMLLAVLSALFGALFFMLSNQYDSASRVLRLDDLFPALIPVPPHLMPKPANDQLAPAGTGRAAAANGLPLKKSARSSHAHPKKRPKADIDTDFEAESDDGLEDNTESDSDRDEAVS